MAPGKKRTPRGLLKTTLTKRARAAEAEAKAIPTANDPQTLWLDEGSDGGEDLSGELAEACLLYSNALDLLAEDPAKAVQLLRGAVHELSRLLRAADADEEEGQGEITKVTRPRAMACYALALCELAEVDEEVEKIDVRTSGSKRTAKASEMNARALIDTARDILPEDTDADTFHILLARARLTLAEARLALMGDEDGVEGLSPAGVSLERAFARDSKVGPWHIRGVTWLLDHLQLRDEEDSLSIWLPWVQRYLRDFIRELKRTGDHRGVQRARFLLTQAAWLSALRAIDQVDLGSDGEEEEEEEDNDDGEGSGLLEQTPEVKEAREKVHEALTLAESVDRAHLPVAEQHAVICLISEAHLHLGNLSSTAEEQENEYAKVAVAANLAKSLEWAGASLLPEGLALFLSEGDEE